MELVNSLDQINNSIKSLSTSGYWSRYYPLISALIAAITAIAATKASVWFSSRRLELNCARALLTEIRQITAQINLALNEEKQSNYVRIAFLAASDRICPIYRGAATTVGLLDAQVVNGVIEFYAALLTIRQLRLSFDHNVDDAFSKEILQSIVNKGTRAIDTLDRTYGQKLK